MLTTSTDGVSLHYQTSGNGDGDSGGTPVVFVSEAGLGGWSWGWQHAALAGPFETVVWDLRGTGRSETPPGPYTLETLADDLEAVLAACDARNAHVVAAGLGGAVALTAARSSSRIETLALVGAGPREEAFDLQDLWAPPTDRDALARSLESAFSADFRSEQPDVLEGIVDWRADGDADEDGWRAQLAALDGFDATRWLVELTQPTLVFHGTADELVDPDAGRELADRLPRGGFVPLEDAGHLAFVEHSRTVNDRLVDFLEEHTRDR